MSSSSSLILRLAKPDDYRFVSKCMMELIGICSGATEEIPELPTLKETFDKCLKEPKFHPLFIAEDNGEKVAMVSCNLFPTPEMGCLTLNIANFVVPPEARSKGIGGKVIQHLKKYAEDNGIKALELITPPENSEKQKERIQFYERHGFFEIGPGFVCPLYDEHHETTLCE